MNDMTSLKDYLANTTPNWDQLTPGTYWLAVGFEKSGKTTAFSTFSETGEDGVLILDLERGVRSNKAISINISSLNVPYKDGDVLSPLERGYYDAQGKPTPALSMSEAIELVENTWKDSGKTTLVIDTIDKFNLWCVQAAMDEIIYEESMKKNPNQMILNARSPEDIPYAAAYTRGRDKVMAVIEALLEIIKENGILVIISHLKKTVTITEAREVVIKRVPAIPEGLASRLGYGAEAIVAIEVDQYGKHTADFRGYSEVIMGTRIEPLNKTKLVWGKEGKSTLYNIVMSLCRNHKKEKKVKKDEQGKESS